MASLWVGYWSTPFTFPLGAYGVEVVHKNLLSLKFNFRHGTLYVEQELFQKTCELCETYLIQNLRVDSGFSWSLDVGSYKVTCRWNWRWMQSWSC